MTFTYPVMGKDIERSGQLVDWQWCAVRVEIAEEDSGVSASIIYFPTNIISKLSLLY